MWVLVLILILDPTGSALVQTEAAAYLFAMVTEGWWSPRNGRHQSRRRPRRA